jgi:hypothetical protein
MNVDQSFGTNWCLRPENYTKENIMLEQKIPRIFVVDDEKMIAETLALIFGRAAIPRASSCTH